MGLNGLLRYLAGTVTFEARNGFGERLLNLCAKQNLNLWDVHAIPEGFTACCTQTVYRQVEELAQKVNVDVDILCQRGVPFLVGKYRRRWGLFAGVAAFVLVSFLSQSFVWEIDVIGNENTPTELILAALDEVGVHKMSFIPGLNFRLQRSQALLLLPQLSYLSINSSGCRLKVNVTERILPPEILEEKSPCDVVASKAGQITYLEVYEGKKMVDRHYTVCEGDVIVSGAYISQKGVPTLVHADAKVMAEVQFDKTLSLDLNQLAKVYTGKTGTRWSLKLFSIRLPLYLALPMEGECDILRDTRPLILFGREMPVSLEQNTYRFYNRKSEAIAIEQARTILQDSFRQYELTELKETAILGRTVRESQKEGSLFMTVSYRAEQNIARQQPIDPERVVWPEMAE